MNMIENQLNKLRELAELQGVPYHKRIIKESADTIEALSAKLAAANMDRSDRYYDVRKELVEQHNKAFELIKKMPLEGNEVWHGYVGGVMQTLGYLIDFVDKSDRHYGGGWQPISEYCRDKYDWVLIEYFDGEEECVPQVAELRSDGKWHVSTDFDGDFIIPPNFDVRYFFDMQQLYRS